MTKQTNDRPVHHYDTEHRRIACGSPGAEDHSTKHARGVTCHACLDILRRTAGWPDAAGVAGA